LFPRLLALSGPLKDSAISLTDGETTVGREPTNSIVVIDPSVSRHHCLFRRSSDGRFLLQDMDSRNGTLINGSRIKEHWLQHGEQISIGDSSFLFQTEDQEPAMLANPVEFD
jgi:pSer/pThr/pTyr-binding forkhead associated (FHA) protein